MNNTFSDLLNICVVVYLDNILIYLDNIFQYQNHIKKVLCQLCKARLYMKARKYEFYSNSVKYLGYILFPFGLTISSNKINMIQNWPELKEVKDVQAFLVFANFYYWFIYNYSYISAPLIWLTWKDIPWNFDSPYYETFNTIKNIFVSAPILIH